MTRDVIQISPIPSSDVKEQLRALEESDRLSAAIGMLISDSGSLLLLLKKISGPDGRYVKKVGNRLVPASIYRRVTFPWLSLGIARFRSKYQSLAQCERFDRELDVYDRCAARLVNQSIRAVVGREDCCELTFTKAKGYGIARIYDLPTLFCDSVKRLLESEIQQFPDAEPELDPSVVFSKERCDRKRRELQLSSHVIVASELVQKSVKEVIPDAQVSVLPYGFHTGKLDTQFISARDRKPHVIFGGNITLRKGVPRLLRAWKRLGANRTHQLKLYGRMSLSRKFLDGYLGQYEHIQRVPHAVFQDDLRHAKALVMPSIADGFGLVVSESISAGTPVVVSNNAGSAELVRNGVHGYRYDYDDDDGLCNALEKLLSDTQSAEQMSAACIELATARNWQAYRLQFLEAIEASVASLN